MLRRIVLVLTGLLVCVGLAIPAGAPAAEGCSNEALRPAGSYSSRLPDCRAYEQVTPLDKNGASPAAMPNAVQASLSGERLAYFVAGNEPGAEGADYPPIFLATRDEEGWTSGGLEAPFQPHGRSQVMGWSEDLSQTLDEVMEITPGAGLNGYLRENPSGVLRLAFHTHGGRLTLAGFSSDGSRMIFEDRDQLLPSAAAGKSNLYEWHDGALSLAGVLPDGSTPPGGSFAGSYDWLGGQLGSGGAAGSYYMQGAISADGSRVFFTAGETGQLYVRENGTRTIQVSASKRGTPDPNGAKPAAFVGASADGSLVFFLSCEKLTDDSTAVSTPAGSCSDFSEGRDLYEYDVDSGALSDLTVAPNPGIATGATVQGVLGVGNGAGGAYVYFVANGALTNNASVGDCGGEVGCDLYVWHDGAVSLIAVLKGALDKSDWQARAIGSEERSARVSAEGSALLFRSTVRLTSEDNAGFNELYRYDAASGRLACVSCREGGLPSTGEASLQGGAHPVLSTTLPRMLPRNLSANGHRLFFETSQALLPRDTNGAQDVYEWEQVGEGDCKESSEGYDADSGGCRYLISTGLSLDESSFADATPNGDDAFFFTGQRLVGQDQDSLADIYDARVGGGIAAQNPPASARCAGEGCREPAIEAPFFAAPVSSVFAGAGNAAPSASTPSAAPKAKKPTAKPKRRKPGAHKRRHKGKKALTKTRGARRGHTTTRRSK